MPKALPQDRNRAIAGLMKSCGPMLLAVARRIVRNDTDADDVVQDAFVSAYTHWDDFRGDSNPCTWLHAIAVRAAIRRSRREGRRRDVAREYARALPFHQPRLADADFDRHSSQARDLRDEARERVDEAVERLPEPFRSAVVLKEIAGMSIADTARVLGVKEATVKTRVHRGRLLLRARLLEKRPRRAVPPPMYSPGICMDLLRAKMDALDRGVDFPIQDELMCDRCRQVLASLDVGADACRTLRGSTMPQALRERIRQALSQAKSEERPGRGRGAKSKRKTPAQRRPKVHPKVASRRAAG